MEEVHRYTGRYSDIEVQFICIHSFEYRCRCIYIWQFTAYFVRIFRQCCTFHKLGYSLYNCIVCVNISPRIADLCDVLHNILDNVAITCYD